MKKAGMIVGILVLVLIVGALIFWATFDVNNYRGRIQSELETRLGRKVALGDMKLSLLPPSFQVSNIQIADDPAFSDPNPFVQAQQISISVKLMPLLAKNVEIDSIELQRPTVELIKNSQGVWNFASIGDKTNSPSSSASGGNQNFSLSKLAVTDGSVAMTDQQAKQPRAVYDHIDATLKDFAPGKPFSLAVAAHLPGPGSQEIKLDGDGGPLAADSPAATPFKGTLSLKDVGLGGLLQFLNNPSLANTDGVVTGETKISSDSGKLAADGALNIDKARVKGVDIGYPIAFNYNVSDDVRGDLLTITSAVLKLGSTPLDVSGTVNTKPTPVDLNLHVKANGVSIAEAAKLAGAFGVAFSPGATVNGQVSTDVTAKGPAAKPALNGTIAMRNIQVTGQDIPKPVQIPAANFQLTPEQIKSDNFNIISDTTTLNANVTVSQYTAKNPILSAVLKAPNAQLPSILAMAKAYGVTGLDKISGQGPLNMDLNLSGPVDSLTSNAIMRALNGTMNLNFNNVRIAGTDISHELSAVGGLLGQAGGGGGKGYTEVSSLTGNIAIVNGIAHTTDLKALLDVANVGATGTANLISQALNLNVTAVMSKAFSQKLGGAAGGGGLMGAALANNGGELVIPATVTGTFSNPRFAPDLRKMAQMRLKGVVPDFNNPQAMSGLAGQFLGNKQGGTKAGQQPANPSSQVDSIIGLFGKKKKK